MTPLRFWKIEVQLYFFGFLGFLYIADTIMDTISRSCSWPQTIYYMYIASMNSRLSSEQKKYYIMVELSTKKKLYYLSGRSRCSQKTEIQLNPVKSYPG